MTATRRTAGIGMALALALAAPGRAGEHQGTDHSMAVYVGTYTDTGSRGIYRFDFDADTGAVTQPRLAATATSPSFLAIDSTGRFLYAVGEVDSFQGKKGGGVMSFEIDPKSGDLTPLNARSSGGPGPCHLVVDRAGKNVLVANYGGGSTAVLPIGADGRLADRSAFVQHTGSSVNPARQKEPHAHSVNLDAANRFAFVADLGLDRVLVYRFDPGKGSITPNEPPAARVAPGAGPRHFAFHSNGAFAYVINELNSTVTAFAYDPGRGTLTEVQTVSTLPDGFGGTNYPADVHVHPSGRFLYGSNRGHDSIVAFAIDGRTGRLTLVGHQGSRVKNPRNFGIAPGGRFALVANQDADTILVFRIDPNSGALTPTDGVVKVAKPVGVQFWSAPATVR